MHFSRRDRYTLNDLLHRRSGAIGSDESWKMREKLKIPQQMTFVISAIKMRLIDSFLVDRRIRFLYSSNLRA